MQFGRRTIWTDEQSVTIENVLEILQNAESSFLANKAECEALLAIDAGKMTPIREKKVRTDIDIKTVDPIAHEIVEFKEGFHWSNQINFVQRGVVDSGNGKEAEAIALFNECFSAENLGKKQKTLGHFVEICGIGYTFIDVKTDWQEGDSYFQYETLDPRYAFVIRSSRYADHRVMLGVTFREDMNGNRFFTAFSKDKRFEVSARKITNGKETKTSWGQETRSGVRNPLGMIPIIEWERSDDRMGVFEREIPEMNRLNLLLSDIANDVDSETQMIWWTNDVEFPDKVDKDGKPTGEKDKPKSNDWISTYTSRDGKTPQIKPLTTPYDYAGLLNNYLSARALILQRCYTPQRNDNSGGSTGIAMEDASGWSAAEQVACSEQLFQEASKLMEAKVALKAIKLNKKVPSDSPLLSLRYIDVKPNVTRQKSYELSIKSNSFATMISHGIHGLHALKCVNLFEDANQVWEDSKALIEKYQNNTFGKEDEIKPQSNDPINQISNSPLIDGMSTGDNN